MKRAVTLTIALAFTSLLSAQAPDFDGYATLGFNGGYAHGEKKGGATFGFIHSSINYSFVMFESSGCRLAFFNENGSKKMNVTELLVLDIGFGHQILKNYYLGFSPFSINLTHSGEFGISLIGKARLFDRLVLEGKVIPKSYTKTDVPMLKNNSYLGAHLWLSDLFALGLRYNLYDDYKNFSIMLSWNGFELN